MIDIRAVVEHMERDSQFANIVNNPAAQFGPEDKPLLGAEILPEEEKRENAYDEFGIKFRAPVANDGTRYSPVQKKKSVRTAHMHVQLSHQDIGSDFDAAEYDAFIHLLQLSDSVGDTRSMEAMAQLTRFVDRAINIPLRHKIEKMRWEAIVNASVVRTGDNGYTETVSYLNPSGHRINASDWDSDANDPYADIVDMVEFLKTKGYTCTRIVTSTPIVAKMSKNAKMRQRLGLLSVVGGIVTGLAGRATLAAINEALRGDNIPSITTYDSQYDKDVGTDYFLARNAMVFICATGRDKTLDLGDSDPIIVRDTLGYVGVGRPAGQSSPGRVVYVNPKTRSKPPHIEAEGWQVALPVITEPEAIGVLLNM